MKKILTVILLLFGTIQLQAQIPKMKKVSLNRLENDMTARVNEKKDVNGNKCAVVIITSNIGDYEVEAQKGIEDKFIQTGEKWLWLSPDEYELIIRKDGYMPLSIDLKNQLEPLETYRLTISDEFGTINVTALDAQIWLDNKPVAKNEYSFHEKEGKYIIKATGDKYYEEEKFVSLYAGETIDLKFDLKPKTGTLVINSNPKDTKKTISGTDTYTTIQLDESNKIIKALIEKGPNSKLNFDETIMYTKLPLTIGNYKLQIEKEGFLPYSQRINIQENQIENILAEMEVDPAISKLNHLKKQRNRNYLFASALVICSTSIVYFGAKNKWEFGSIGGGALAGTLLSGLAILVANPKASEYRKAKKKLAIQPTYFKNQLGLTMNLTF